MKLEIKPFVLGANALLKELEHRPHHRVVGCESRLSALVETNVEHQGVTCLNGGK